MQTKLQAAYTPGHPTYDAALHASLGPSALPLSQPALAPLPLAAVTPAELSNLKRILAGKPISETSKTSESAGRAEGSGEQQLQALQRATLMTALPESWPAELETLSDAGLCGSDVDYFELSSFPRTCPQVGAGKGGGRAQQHSRN